MRTNTKIILRQIGAKIAYFRTLAGISQKDLADRIKTTQSTVSKVENGSFNRIGRVRLRNLTAAFNKMKRDEEGVIDETIKSITQ